MNIRKAFFWSSYYINVKEAAAKWGVTGRMVNYYCANGRIQGAQKIGILIFPKDAVQPDDRQKGSRNKLAQGVNQFEE